MIIKPGFFLHSLKASALILCGLWCLGIEAVAQVRPPTLASGSTVDIFDRERLQTGTVVQVAGSCYKVDIKGRILYFHKKAFHYSSDFPGRAAILAGRPAVLDWFAAEINSCYVNLGDEPSQLPAITPGTTVVVHFDGNVQGRTASVVEVSDHCLSINLSGWTFWVQKGALERRTYFPGNPAVLEARFTVPKAECPTSPVRKYPAPAQWTSPASVCLNATPAPVSALITFDGWAASFAEKILRILPKCVAFSYGDKPIWTTPNEAGGVGCVGNIVQIDYGKANEAFNAYKTMTAPAACEDNVPVTPKPSGPPPVATPAAQPPAFTSTPSGQPPIASGPTVGIYYGKTFKMATALLVAVTEKCYQISDSGNNLWFPKSALGYRTDFPGNPVGLDYEARRYTPCADSPPPVATPPATPPPGGPTPSGQPPVAKSTAHTLVCLNASPQPTSALITNFDPNPRTTAKIEQVLPKCLAWNYGKGTLWTTANEAGGVSCAGNTVQIDYFKAIAFDFYDSSTTPAVCKEIAAVTPTPSSQPPVAARPVQPPPATSTPLAPPPAPTPFATPPQKTPKEIAPPVWNSCIARTPIINLPWGGRTGGDCIGGVAR